jgi:hypothetical protein
VTTTNWLPAAHITGCLLVSEPSLEVGEVLDKHNKVRNLIILGFIAGLVTLGAAVASTRKSAFRSRNSQRPNLPISKTTVLQLLNSDIANGFVHVSLRNVSSKNVNGIQLSINGSISQIEFLDADEPHQRLVPGSVYDEWFAYSGGSTPVQVAVLAVTFDDKTFDGDRALAAEIIDTRRGRKNQLTRFTGDLAKALTSTEADSLTTLDKLKLAVTDLPDGTSTDSGAMRMGQRQGKEEISRELEYIRNRHVMRGQPIRQSLIELMQRYHHRIRNLE